MHGHTDIALLTLQRMYRVWLINSQNNLRSWCMSNMAGFVRFVVCAMLGASWPPCGAAAGFSWQHLYSLPDMLPMLTVHQGPCAAAVRRYFATYNGVQVMTVPTSGTYFITMAGGGGLAPPLAANGAIHWSSPVLQHAGCPAAC